MAYKDCLFKGPLNAFMKAVSHTCCEGCWLFFVLQVKFDQCLFEHVTHGEQMYVNLDVFVSAQRI